MGHAESRQTASKTWLVQLDRVFLSGARHTVIIRDASVIDFSYVAFGLSRTPLRPGNKEYGHGERTPKTNSFYK